MGHMAIARAALAVPISLALAGCSGGLGGLGGLGDILGGAVGGGGETRIRAEVQDVNRNDQTISVVTAEGQSGAVRYDQNTQVIYQQQQYPVTALERGDLVVMQLQQSSSGETYVGRIEVEQSVQERGGVAGTGQRQMLQGRVGQIDQSQGAFQLQTQQGTTVVVTLPYNPPSQMLDRFRRLRQGEHVSIEGTVLSQTRVELYRFR